MITQVSSGSVNLSFFWGGALFAMHLWVQEHVAPQMPWDLLHEDVHDHFNRVLGAPDEEVAVTLSSGAQLLFSQEVLEVCDANFDISSRSTVFRVMWQLSLAFPIVRAVVLACWIHLAFGLRGRLRCKVDHDFGWCSMHQKLCHFVDIQKAP